MKSTRNQLTSTYAICFLILISQRIKISKKNNKRWEYKHQTIYVFGALIGMFFPLRNETISLLFQPGQNEKTFFIIYYFLFLKRSVGMESQWTLDYRVNSSTHPVLSHKSRDKHLLVAIPKHSIRFLFPQVIHLNNSINFDVVSLRAAKKKSDSWLSSGLTRPRANLAR
jgi:hypothetical protein